MEINRFNPLVLIAILTAFIAGSFDSRLFGIFMFAGLMLSAFLSHRRMHSADSRPILRDSEPVRQESSLTDNNSHLSQVNYSQLYSQKKDDPKNDVRDKDLSEAERNVLYGR